MTCGQCGAALQPGSGFCGACGRPAAQQQQQWQQPPQQQQWQQPPQQQQWQQPPQQQPWQQPPQQQQWQQPPQQQQWQQPPQQQWQQQPPQQQWQQQPPQQQWQQPAPQGRSLTPFALIMQKGMTRLTGHMFVAPQRLFFICESQKGGLTAAIGQNFGLLGAAIAGMMVPTPGQAAPVIDEGMLFKAAQEKPGSLVMEPANIKAIKVTWLWRAIWYAGQTYALPKGLSKELNSELAGWCQANNVTNAGLKLRAPAPPQ